MTKILLADDHPVIRSGLKIIIEKIITSSVIDEVWSAGAAYEKLNENEYSLVILDATIAGVDSYSLVKNTLLVKPGAKILMFSINNEDVYASKYLQLGAKGYLCKNASEIEIESAIHNVLNNKRYVSASLLESFAENILRHRATNPFENLSPREFEIVQHLIRGESVAEISKNLHLHTSTVGTHKARIFKKLKCKNIIEISASAKVNNVAHAFT
jgi:DNA-binding NarL/FixJ family response regulator